MMDSLTPQPVLLATCLGTDTAGCMFTTDTAPVAVGNPFGWTTFVAVEEKQALQLVNIVAGAVATVITVKQFQFHASRRG